MGPGRGGLDAATGILSLVVGLASMVLVVGGLGIPMALLRRFGVMVLFVRWRGRDATLPGRPPRRLGMDGLRALSIGRTRGRTCARHRGRCPPRGSALLEFV